MPKLENFNALRELREQLKGDISKRQATNATITVGMGTCGIAAGARETMQAILAELERRGINVHVTTVGCIGMCSREPLVDIQMGDEPRITYGEVSPQRVPRLIEEHVVNNRVVDEWVVGRVGEQGE